MCSSDGKRIHESKVGFYHVKPCHEDVPSFKCWSCKSLAKIMCRRTVRPDGADSVGRSFI
jgi:hypothetical protein